MNPRTVLHTISYVLFFVACAELASLLVSLIAGDDATVRWGLAGAAAVTAAAAGLLWLTTRGTHDLKRRDGYAVVTFGWLAAAAFGTLPYLLTGAIPQPAAAFFESMSGFTTTGASVMSDLESQARGVMFWRSISQWIGGMGVLVLVIAILPFLGVGATALYKAEIPGPSKDRLTPQIATTAKILWFIYLGLTALCALLLKLGGMTWYECVNHAFTTLSTGGFSTRSASIEGFDSGYIEGVVVVFMLLAGINFSLHFRALGGRVLCYWRDREVRMFLILLVGAVGALSLSLWLGDNAYDNLGQALRVSVFEVVSIVTTTGFGGPGAQAFATWTHFAVLLVFLLTYFGGCAGSTSGGIKIVRLVIGAKWAMREIRLILMPKAVYKIRLGSRPVADGVAANTAGFLVLFVALSALGAVAVSFFAPDVASAASASVTCVANVGPGLGAVGPDGDFACIEAPGQVLLAMLMLMGRLELFTFLVIFTRMFWKK